MRYLFAAPLLAAILFVGGPLPASRANAAQAAAGAPAEAAQPISTENKPAAAIEASAPVPAPAQPADDSARLLALANELKSAMDKTTKDMLSVTVVRKAAEIEKLAHRMRSK
jgi:PPE-repeat protein